MENNVLTRVQKLASSCSASTHHAHSVSATILRQLVSSRSPEHKWVAIVRELRRLDAEVAGFVLAFLEDLPEIDRPTKAGKQETV